MQAGKFLQIIDIESVTSAVNEAGTPVQTWTHKDRLRAEVVSETAEEFIRSYGASEECVIVFRTRFQEGITAGDRVVFQGQSFNIKLIMPLGRRRGLELRCVAVKDAL
uniref:Phage head-tail adaptor, putative n=1 Tax=Cereibacter sphaeroides (strain ATCC 17025 / ATH 2.4.3) TaxID=349102 RepID=A4WSA1_CERS5